MVWFILGCGKLYDKGFTVVDVAANINKNYWSNITIVFGDNGFLTKLKSDLLCKA